MQDSCADYTTLLRLISAQYVCIAGGSVAKDVGGGGVLFVYTKEPSNNDATEYGLAPLLVLLF